MGNNCCTSLNSHVQHYKSEQRKAGEKVQIFSQFVRTTERNHRLFQIVAGVITIIPIASALGISLKVVAVISAVLKGTAKLHTSDEYMQNLDTKIKETQETLDRLELETKKLVKTINTKILKKHKIKYRGLSGDDLQIDTNRFKKYGKSVFEAVVVLNVTFEAIRLSNTLSATEDEVPNDTESPNKHGIMRYVGGCLGSEDLMSEGGRAAIMAVPNIIENVVNAARSESDTADVMDTIANLLTNE